MPCADGMTFLIGMGLSKIHLDSPALHEIIMEILERTEAPLSQALYLA